MFKLKTLAWELIYRDTFDRECPPHAEKKGRGLRKGLYDLWLYTLSEGIAKDGTKTFSDFSLWFADDRYLAEKYQVNARYDGGVDTRDPAKLAALRKTIFGERETIADKKQMMSGGKDMLRRIAESHERILVDKKDRSIPITIAEASRSALASLPSS